MLNDMRSYKIWSDSEEKYGRYRVSPLFFLSAVVLFLAPFNLEIGVLIRPADLGMALLVVMVAIANPRFNASTSSLVGLFILMLAMTTWAGLAERGLVDLRGIAYVYKLVLPFLVFWAFSHAVPGVRQNRKLLAIALGVLVILIVWAWIHFFLNKYRVVDMPNRSSFPFTNWGGKQSDGHMFSLTLAVALLSMVWLCWYRILCIRLKYAALVLVLGLSALFLTGSRTGLVVLIVSGVLWVLWEALRSSLGAYDYRIRKSSVAFLSVALVVLALIPFFYMSASEFIPNDIEYLITRASNFDFTEEDSRIRKTIYGFEKSLQGFPLLGVGALSSGLAWYDSGPTALVVYSGVAGLMVYVCLLIWVVFHLGKMSRNNGRKHEFYCFVWILFAYALGNIATEFWMVTRSVLPVVALLGILAAIIKIPNKTVMKTYSASERA